MISVIGKLFNLLSPSERKYLYFLFFALALMAVIEMAGIASIMPFMAVVARPEVVENNWWMKQIYDFLGFSSIKSFLIFLGLTVLGLLIFSNLFKAMTAWLTLRYDNQLNYILARRLLAQYLARPYSFFLNHNTAEMGKNILTEVRTVIAGVLSPGMRVLSNTLVSLLIFVLLIAVDIVVAVTIALMIGGTYVLLYLFVRKRLVRIGKEQVQANSMKYKVAGEALTGIKDLKILGCERVFLDRFSVQALLHSQNNVTAGIIALLPKYVLEILSFGGLLLIVLYYLNAARGPEQMIPLLALYAFAGYRLMPAMQNIFVGIATVRFNLASLEVLHREMVEEAMGDSERILTKPSEVKPLLPARDFELHNITFAYDGAQEPVLKELNLKIAVNTTIGFVGGTGAGKTTTVDIILGLLTPTSGELLVDGTTINGQNLCNWQQSLGYVPQSIFLCDDTIIHNIAFGVPESEIDREAVIQAARIANLDKFITDELPDGYETEIGERGIRLSGGQRQRIGIARALYRNPSVLVMDEATSSLDGITETAVMEAIRTLTGKKTIILIAHRLTTVRDCDVIYQLEHGRIVNHGSYADLQKTSELFHSVG